MSIVLEDEMVEMMVNEYDPSEGHTPEQLFENLRLMAISHKLLSDKLSQIKTVVNRQAEDERLWFLPEYVTEDYLQQELRKLHAVIELSP